MRVVKEGSQEFSYNFECNRCGSELEVIAEDVQVGPDRDYGPDYFVVCGVCEGLHPLESVTIPYLVKLQARQRRDRGAK